MRLESMPANSDLCRDRAQCVANYLQPVDRDRSNYRRNAQCVRTHVEGEMISRAHANLVNFPTSLTLKKQGANHGQ